MAKLGTVGVLYEGLDIMGNGSILIEFVLAAIATFVIEGDFAKAAAFALVGAVLTYFGFMFGPAVGIGHSFCVRPSVALAYGVVAAFLFALSRRLVFAATRWADSRFCSD